MRIEKEAAMWRFMAGVFSALLLAAAGLFFWQGSQGTHSALSAAPLSVASPLTLADTPEPASASPKSKEEKRFNRYDKDRNGAVGQEEYLLSRRKTFAKLDANGDGTLQFAEYASKTVAKFTKADGDKSGGLNRAEFASTRVLRKQQRKPNCPPSLTMPKPIDETAAEAQHDA
jgi:EF hand